MKIQVEVLLAQEDVKLAPHLFFEHTPQLLTRS